MNPNKLLRLALAKTFLTKAQSALKQGNDDLSLASAVVNMHDCLDNFLGVLASELDARLEDKDTLSHVLVKVDNAYKDKYGEALPSKSEIRYINYVRNGVKHNGILPNTTQVVAAVSELARTCNSISEKVFGIRLEDISLVSQVKDHGKRKILMSIEKDITKGDYKRAMLSSANALFYYHERNAWNLSDFNRLFTRKNNVDEKNIFPERDSNSDDLQLMQYGIDPYLYHRFKNLVPKIGYANLREKKLIKEYDSLTWHERNWTAENARFCFSFITRLFLGQQRDYGGYKIIHKRTQERVTFKRDSQAVVGLTEDKTVTFKKGQTIHGYVDGFINGRFEGFRKGNENEATMWTLDNSSSKFEIYTFKLADSVIESVDVSYEHMDR